MFSDMDDNAYWIRSKLIKCEALLSRLDRCLQKTSISPSASSKASEEFLGKELTEIWRDAKRLIK